MDWLAALMRRPRGSGEQEAVRLREQTFASETESVSIAGRLKELNIDRERLTKRLTEATTEEDARLHSQRLRGLDTEERALRIRWARVDRELEQHRQALENLRNLPRVDLKQVEEDLKRVTALTEQRATDQRLLIELEREAAQRQEVAQQGVERAATEQAPDPYLQMWRASRASRTGAQEQRGQEPPRPTSA
jgi:homoserine trans-succinylase